jgi:hypothetical protein
MAANKNNRMSEMKEKSPLRVEGAFLGFPLIECGNKRRPLKTSIQGRRIQVTRFLSVDEYEARGAALI